MLEKFHRCIDFPLVIRYFLRSAPMRPMPSMVHSGTFFSLFLAFPLLLAGCATIGGEPAEKVTYDNSRNPVKVAPRERSATVTREAPERLMNQGYVELGNLTVTYRNQRCFGDDCDTKSHSETPTQRLLHEAAKHGGDVVILRQDKVSGSKGVTRQGKCVRTDRVSVPYQQCYYATECTPSQPPYYTSQCTQRQTNCQTEYRLETRCVQFGVDYGSETVLESAAMVWRYDPGLANQSKQVQIATELFVAASQGDVRVVQDSLAQGLSPNAPNSEGRPLLVVAAANGQMAIINLLIESGADVNGRDKQGANALYAAAAAGHAEIVKALFARRADLNVRDLWGWTPLFIAAFAGRTETVEALLVSGADANVRNDESWTPLMTAASHGNTKTVQVLLAHGADVNAKDKHGDTALMSPASSGKTATVQALLDGGADVNVKPNNGRTALILAAEWGHTATVQALLEKRADSSVRDKDGGTALTHAIKRGHASVVQLLKQVGANE